MKVDLLREGCFESCAGHLWVYYGRSGTGTAGTTLVTLLFLLQVFIEQLRTTKPIKVSKSKSSGSIYKPHL